jgi:HAMP domain-containing protein
MNAVTKGQSSLDPKLLLSVLTAVKKGDFSARMPLDWTGINGKIADTLNDIIDLEDKTSRGLERVSNTVGKEGKLAERMSLGSGDGAWARQVESVNALISDLGRPTTEMARVIGAVAKGDLTQRMVTEADDKPIQGEFMRTAKIVNTMVDQLNAFAGEVTRVAREVGTEGKLGGQAQVQGVADTWKDLTDNVNSMASNLTGQVRNIAEVATAVANSDLSKKITVDVKGEILELKNTINVMVDQLNAFAGEVTRVAREVGTEGTLGGQAQVEGVAGTWKDLTDNVNSMAGNLTSQVRAIADVATAVTKGDLTRSIGVAAEGEVAVLKDNINEMIRNLKDTTEKNTEQDWLKTNLTRFTRILQGQREMLTVCKLILTELAPLVKAQHGVFYGMEGEKDDARLGLQASYAYKERKNLSKQFRLGEGLVGECALAKERILLTNVPGDYVQINSGLGEATPMNVVVLPVLFEGVTKAVLARAIGIDAIEIARRKAFLGLDEADVRLLTQLHMRNCTCDCRGAQRQFVDDFYAHLLTFEKTRRFITHAQSLDRLKRTQAVYFESLRGHHAPTHRARAPVVPRRTTTSTWAVCCARSGGCWVTTPINCLPPSVRIP